MYETKEAAHAALKPGYIVAFVTGNNRPEGKGWGFFETVKRAEANALDVEHFDSQNTRGVIRRSKA